jgi:Mg-chelatase subunit ChlD
LHVAAEISFKITNVGVRYQEGQHFVNGRSTVYQDPRPSLGYAGNKSRCDVKKERSRTMSNRKLLALVPALLLTIILTGCAAEKPIDIIPVTVVPPVNYPPTQPPPVTLPTAMPTAALYATSTPYREVAQQQEPEVRAGEVDDNEKWREYLEYRRDYRGPIVHDVDISERYIITAMDQENQPILDASVTIWDGQYKLWEARTSASGQTLFFPRSLSSAQSQTYVVSVNKDGFAYTFEMPRGQQESWVVKLDQYASQRSRVNLDILFLLDSTGSMSDEISALQTSMLSIADQIDHLRPRPDLRFGLVTYRDRGDAYVVAKVDFTSHVRAFSDQLGQIRAAGGGDYPESLNEALHTSIYEMDWREEDTIRLIFLVADAPPHLDYGQDFDYAQEMAVALANGIKIFPIAASGTDDQAEYIFRQMAQFTMARFIFLTYEGPESGGGEPGDVSSMNVSSYGVQDLDDLVVRLVEDELSHQQGQ